MSFNFRRSRSFPNQVVSDEKLFVGTDRPDLIIIYRADEEMQTYLLQKGLPRRALLQETRLQSPPLPAGTHLCSGRFLIHSVLKEQAMDPPEGIYRDVASAPIHLKT